MNKRKPIQARCFRDGIPIGVMTLTEWCEVADIDYTNAYNALKKGGRTKAPDGAKLQFVEVKPGEPDYIQSLSEVNEEAREKGKSYGQLQAEKYLQEHPIIAKKEEAKEEAQEAQEEEMEDKITLRQFAALVNGACALHIQEHTDYDEDRWLMTIPADSPVIAEGLAADWIVECFVLTEGEGSLTVYVKTGVAE